MLTVFEDGHYLIQEDAFLSVVGNGLSIKDRKRIEEASAGSKLSA